MSTWSRSTVRSTEHRALTEIKVDPGAPPPPPGLAKNLSSSALSMVTLYCPRGSLLGLLQSDPPAPLNLSTHLARAEHVARGMAFLHQRVRQGLPPSQ